MRRIEDTLKEIDPTTYRGQSTLNLNGSQHELATISLVWRNSKYSEKVILDDWKAIETCKKVRDYLIKRAMDEALFSLTNLKEDIERYLEIHKQKYESKLHKALSPTMEILNLQASGMENWIVCNTTYCEYKGGDIKALQFKVIRPADDKWLKNGEIFESCSGNLNLGCEIER